jgi:uncharacterized protein (DUF1697 family)
VTGAARDGRSAAGQTARMTATTVYVALLRGINVGGRAVLPMADLRRVATGCGFGDVQTYIQSGNLVFTSSAPATTVATELGRAIAAEGGPKPGVAVRSHAQLAAVVAGNPYLDRSTDPKQLHVAFVVEGARPHAVDDLDLARFEPDELTVAEGETYLFLPNGMGRSKLAEVLGRQQGADATVRNWRTVTKLLDLATDLTRGPG